MVLLGTGKIGKKDYQTPPTSTIAALGRISIFWENLRRNALFGWGKVGVSALRAEGGAPAERRHDAAANNCRMPCRSREPAAPLKTLEVATGSLRPS